MNKRETSIAYVVGIMFLLVYKFRVGIYDWTILAAVIAGYFALFDERILIERRVVYAFLGVGVLYVYIIISTFIQIPDSSFYALKYSRVFLSLISTYIILYKLVNIYRISTLEYCLALVLLAHPLFMVIQASIPEIKYFWMELYWFTGHYHEHRVVGILNGHTSAGDFLGIISAYFAYITVKYKSKLFLIVFIGIAPLFLISSLTGGIIYLISFSYLFYSLTKNKNYEYMKYLVCMCFGVLGGSILLISVFPSAAQSLGISGGIRRITVIFVEDQTARDDPRGSFESLLRTSYPPSSRQDFIFGNLEPSATKAATTHTDSGLFASWHTLGIIGLSILLFSKILFAYVSKSLFIWVLTLLFIIVFIKNDISYSRIFFDYYIVAFLLVLFQQLRQEGTHSAINT